MTVKELKNILEQIDENLTIEVTDTFGDTNSIKEIYETKEHYWDTLSDREEGKPVKIRTIVVIDS